MDEETGVTSGRLVAFTITPGQRGDAPVAADLVTLLPASVTLAADRTFRRIKDFRRVATRYDKLAATYAAAISLAALVAWWL